MASQRQASIAAARMPPPQRRDAWSVLPVAVACIIACPVAVVVGYAFVPAGEVWAHLADTVLPRYVANTVVLIVSVAAATFVVGVGTAWLVSMARFPLRGVFEWALILPFALPAYVLAYTYTGLLDVGGPVQGFLRDGLGFSGVARWFPGIRSLAGAAAMLTLALYPYVYLLARAAFLEQGAVLAEASRTLGRGPWATFASVSLPIARPGIAAGLALVVMEALNDYGTVDFFAVDTFTTGIYRAWFGLGEAAAAAQLSSILLVFVCAVLLAERWTRGRGRVYPMARRMHRPPARVLRGKAAFGAASACALPVVLGFALPAAALLVWTVENAAELFDWRYAGFAFNSLFLSALTAAVAVALAVAIAYAVRLRPRPATAAAARAAGLGYAVPGSVIAVGILLFSTWFDKAVDFGARSVFGVSTGLVFTGTVAGIVFAYVVRFMALSIGTVESALGRVSPNMDAAARSLGRKPLGVLAHVHLPLMWGSLAAAGLLVFVDVMKELPATLILRPFDFDTLAVRAHQLASDELLTLAAGPALAIVAVGILPVIVLSRAIKRLHDPAEAAP